MSEATPPPENALDSAATALPGLPVTPLVPPSVTPQASFGKGYWELTWQQFKKRRESYVAMFLLAALFLMALTAPMLANNLPWYFRTPQNSGIPLLRDFILPLSGLDRFYNCVFMTLLLAAAAFLIGKFVPGIRPAASETLQRARYRRLYLSGLLLAFLGMFAAATMIGGRNDRTDYKRLAAQPGNTVVFTLIPYGPLEDDSTKTDKEPRPGHMLGNDNNGFDVLARIIHGSRISLSVGFLAIGLAVTIGILVGSTSGYFGGWVDILVSRVIEVFMCFPSFFLILTIIAVAPRRSIFWVMFAIGLTGWMGIARLIRGEVLKVRQLDYIQAAKALGATDHRIIFRHIMPNALAPVLVAATFGVAGAILAETGLGFLGLGVEPPTPSWGELLNQARQDPVRLWWLTVFPGFMIFMSVVLMNLVGEGLRDAMDPKLRK